MRKMSESNTTGAIILLVVFGVLFFAILLCWIDTEYRDMTSYSNMLFGDDTRNDKEKSEEQHQSEDN